MEHIIFFLPAIIVLALITWTLAGVFGIRRGPQMVCTSCGTIGAPKTITRGSILIEIVLWLCFIIPGLIYSIWRHTTRRNGCRSCGADTLVPVNSPIGKKLIAEYAPKLE